MVFNTLTFFVFFAIVVTLHSLPFAWTTRKINLLIASYVFYAAWKPPFILLLWISTVVDWYATACSRSTRSLMALCRCAETSRSRAVPGASLLV